MRKTILGLLAATVLFFSFTGSALAETESTEHNETNEQPANTIDCTLVNFTNPSLKNEDGTYSVGTPIDMELIVQKGGELNPYFIMSDGHSESSISAGTFTTTWTPTEAGTYSIRGEFHDGEGNFVEVENPEACSATLTVVYIEPAHPDHSDEVEMPVAPPAEEPKPVDNTCKDDDPSTLTSVNNPDGTVSYYSPDGVYCATVLPKAPISPTPQPAAKPAPAVQQTAATATLPRTGLKDSLPLYGAAFLACGLLFTLAGKKHAARVAAK